MAQKKKKNAILSSADRAAMIATNWTDQRAERLKDFKSSFNKEYQRLVGAIGAEKPDQISAENKSAYQKVFDVSMKSIDDPDMSYAYIIRCLALGYWMKNKIVYRVSKETVEFIQNLHLFENLHISFSELLSKICKTPIYIEIQGIPNRMGLFMCTTTAIPPSSNAFDEIVDDPAFPCFFCLPIDSEAARISCFKPGNAPVKEIYKTGKVNDRSINFYYEIAVYIAYCLSMNDSIGSVFIQRPGKAYTHFDVNPIPYRDSLPDFTRSDGWIAAGLCHAFGYLNRETMKKNFQADIEKTNFPRTVIYNTTDDDTSVDFDEIATALVQKSVLDWEQNKIVYQYTDEVAETLSRKYFDDITLFGLPDELLRYMPYEASILLNRDTGEITMANRCKIRYQNRNIYGGVLFLAFNITTQAMEAAMLTGNPGKNYFFRDGAMANQLIGATDVMYHILTVMRTKAQKRITKELLFQAPSEAGLLVPTEESTTHLAREKVSEDPAVRIGENILEPTCILNEVTARTVKRMPQNEALERGGWKMIPHMRRRHPHRYWVGKGSEKHLETRWLESMKINDGEKKRKQAAVIHNIKT